MSQTFTDDDVRLLSIIAAQSAQIIDNARLYEEEQELLKLREETRMAAQIQKNLLPKSDPEILLTPSAICLAVSSCTAP